MYIWSEFEDIDFYFCTPLGAVCRGTTLIFLICITKKCVYRSLFVLHHLLIKVLFILVQLIWISLDPLYVKSRHRVHQIKAIFGPFFDLSIWTQWTMWAFYLPTLLDLPKWAQTKQLLNWSVYSMISLGDLIICAPSVDAKKFQLLVIAIIVFLDVLNRL